MRTLASSFSGIQMLAELREFACFPAETQDYIRNALAVRFGTGRMHLRSDDDPTAARSNAARIGFYACLDQVAAAVPRDDDLSAVAALMRGLVPLTAFDIAHTAIGSFAAYRFLYERLIGAAVRPWLAGAFCTAAALPALHPQHRLRLLSSLDEESFRTCGWTCREPVFRPQPLDGAEG